MRALGAVSVFMLCVQAQPTSELRATEEAQPERRVGPTPIELSVSWATALASRFVIVGNTVVSAHSLGRLGELICAHDRLAASGVYRQAIIRINSIPPEVFFDEKQPVLPIASFTGLWRMISASAQKCDPGAESLLNAESFKQRRYDEQRAANNGVLIRALQLIEDNPERAGQLVELVLEAGDPDGIDFAMVEKFLASLRDRAPELGDKVFRVALDTAVDAPRGSTSALSQLGVYLFVDPNDVYAPDKNNLSRTITIGTSDIFDFRRVRSSADPDAVEAYMRAVIRLSERAMTPQTSAIPMSGFDSTVAYALALQMTAHARELELSTSTELMQLSTRLYTGQAGQVEVAVGGGVGDVEASEGARVSKRMREILTAIRRKKFEDARRALNGLGDAQVSPRLSSLIDFAEASAAVSSGALQLATSLASGLRPGGVKRTLIYAGVAEKSDIVRAQQLASIASRDVQALPAEFRAAMYSALAAALLGDPDRAYLFMRDIVTAMNDARINPRAARFEPRPEIGAMSRGAGGGTDVSGIPLATSRFFEVLDTGTSRYSMDLSVAGVNAFSLPVLLSRATHFEMQRLEALVSSVRDDAKQAEAMLAIAGLRLKIAEAEKEVPVGAR
jgi:hypothetical protein